MIRLDERIRMIGLVCEKNNAAQDLIERYVYLFVRGVEELQKVDMPAYSIHMKNDKPITVSPYRFEFSGKDRVESTGRTAKDCRSYGGFTECFYSSSILS